ncbi:MAG TPA: precorrin-6y C5,15-methyltransferase (decarboxylating) subunit CbiE, partial [Polyangiaceae bacterium]|nr:precorrin-6y C5,15-methyltransferase (decarboxylating) subunit CbiE [Polyangiaceae bacterium]
MSFELSPTPAQAPTPASAPGAVRPWLTLVGVGAEGVAGLGAAARAAILEATLVVGSERQLELVRPLLRGEKLLWLTPFSLGIERVLERRGQPTCVLASGDPFFFGVGATLSSHLPRAELICHPAPSSFSLAAARLGWALQELELISLHGRELHAVLRYLHAGRRILALSWNKDTPAELARLLTERGFGRSRLTVLEALGGPAERLREQRANEAPPADIQDLNLVAIEVEAEPGTLRLGCRASLPDSAFEHDGQLTKQDIRALTLSALQPRPGARLWDVGAGAGSIAIEWLLSHPACSAIAIERDAVRCERIRRNARALGVPGLELVQGSAPEALATLARPDAIFIGGGASRGVLDACWGALAPGGRLVVNAVSLETEALLLGAHAEHGGELRRLAIESAAAL